MTNEQTTGDDGKATFQLEYGDYVATISKDGYQTVTENIAFRSNHKNFNITLEETGGFTKVTGIVKNTSNEPITDGMVTLSDIPSGLSGAIFYGASNLNNDGTFTFMEFDGTQISSEEAIIHYGTYWIEFSTSEYYLLKQVTISSNDNHLELTAYGENEHINLNFVDGNNLPLLNTFVSDGDLIIDEQRQLALISVIALNDNTGDTGQITTANGVFGDISCTVGDIVTRFTLEDGDTEKTIVVTSE